MTEMNKYLEYDSGRIHFSDHGKGAVIMLVHGYLETSEIWESFARRLSERFRVIAVDLPGHGKSTSEEKILSTELMASILAKLISDLNIKKVFLTGHSLGGYVTLAFAELFPDLLTGYCLLHSHPFSDDDEKLEKRRIEIKLVEEGKKNLFIPFAISKLYATVTLDKFSKAVERSKKIASTISAETIIAVLKGMMARPDRLSVLESAEIPHLWILGAQDNLINCETIQSKVRIPSNSKVVVLQNSGHMGFIEEESLSASAIESFIQNKLQS